MKPCYHCSCSGIYIGYGGYNHGTQNDGIIAIECKCKYCQGKGWIDEDQEMTVPRKYVKDEYFKEKP